MTILISLPHFSTTTKREKGEKSIDCLLLEISHQKQKQKKESKTRNLEKSSSQPFPPPLPPNKKNTPGYF